MWGVLLSLSAACSAEQSGDNPFLSGPGQTSAPPSTTAAGTGDGDTGEGSSGEDGDGLGSSDGAVGSTGTDDPSGSTGDPGGDESSGGGGNPNGMQPGAGMYADCLDNSACGAQMCLTITDMAMNPIDGFCTMPCTNPALDCDASPIATATPACMETTVNGMASAVCALACSGGAGCPAPMTCYNFGAAGEFCG